MREEEVSPYEEIVAHREKIDAMNRNMVPSDIDAYGYLQGIYQGRWRYEPERARAARDCLPFERPKLAVIAKVGETFAERLEEAIARRMARPQVTNGMKVIEPKKEGAD